MSSWAPAPAAARPAATAAAVRPSRPPPATAEEQAGRHDDVDKQQRERPRRVERDGRTGRRCEEPERAARRARPPPVQLRHRREQGEVEGDERTSGARSRRRAPANLTCGQNRRPGPRGTAGSAPARRVAGRDPSDGRRAPRRRARAYGHAARSSRAFRGRRSRPHARHGNVAARPAMTTTPVTRCSRISPTAPAPSASHVGPAMEIASAVDAVSGHQVRGSRTRRSSTRTTSQPPRAPAGGRRRSCRRLQREVDAGQQEGSHVARRGERRGEGTVTSRRRATSVISVPFISPEMLGTAGAHRQSRASSIRHDGCHVRVGDRARHVRPLLVR